MIKFFKLRRLFNWNLLFYQNHIRGNPRGHLECGSAQLVLTFLCFINDIFGIAEDHILRRGSSQSQIHSKVLAAAAVNRVICLMSKCSIVPLSYCPIPFFHFSIVILFFSFIVPLSIVHHPVFIVHCPLAIVQCPINNVQCPIYNFHCPLANVHYPMSIVHCSSGQ